MIRIIGDRLMGTSTSLVRHAILVAKKHPEKTVALLFRAGPKMKKTYIEDGLEIPSNLLFCSYDGINNIVTRNTIVFIDNLDIFLTWYFGHNMAGYSNYLDDYWHEKDFWRDYPDSTYGTEKFEDIDLERE